MSERKSKKILIVDDEPGVVEIVRVNLEWEGYDICEAFDGQEGLKKARELEPDLIILDLMLPKIDGYKVCGLLKSDSRYNKIPIIIFTALAQTSNKEMGMELGADAFITKHFKSEVLLKKIKELIGE